MIHIFLRSLTSSAQDPQPTGDLPTTLLNLGHSPPDLGQPTDQSRHGADQRARQRAETSQSQDTTMA